MGYTYPDAIITTAGHVDHGKTTLVHALSGTWVARYSEEIKRAMTIKLGYTTISIYECPSIDDEFRFLSDGLLKNGKCPNGDEPVFKRRISILDVPGHEVLISTMISGIAFVDTAILVIDASMPVPQPQTEEHFIALTIMGLKRLLVVQNKIDLVPREKAIENYNQIRGFLRGTWAEDSPIVPVSSLHGINIDAVSTLLNKIVPPKSVDSSSPFRMLVLRSFNVNKPGTPPEKLVGGVLGGTVVRGSARVGDEIEIRPGLKLGDKYEPIFTRIISIAIGNDYVEEARPGGLLGLGTELDPALTKADSLVGNVVGKPGTLPPVWVELELEFHRIERRNADPSSTQFKPKDVVMINVGSASVMGIVKEFRRDRLTVTLRRAVCSETNLKAVVTRQVGSRWRIVGYGVLKGGKSVLE